MITSRDTLLLIFTPQGAIEGEVQREATSAL